MTLYIFVCVALGFAVGLADIVPIGRIDAVILGLLLALVFGVGIEVGARGDAWASIRALGPRLIAIPFLSALGSLLGIALVATLAWGYPWPQACALGSAFGWYTLSGPILTHFAGPEIGALAFLSDVTRELTALVLIPTIARRLGAAEAVALGGATSMDTTFPVLSHATGGSAAPLAFAHGVVLALLAPLLLPFWFSF